MKKIKLISFSILLLILCSCAPHNHYYKSLGRDNEDKLKIFCTEKEKIWLFDGYSSDSILIQSKHFKELINFQVMDTLSYRSKNTQKTFLIKINDNKFHNQVKDDTISLEYKKNGTWMEEKFIIIKDNRIK
ncbi:hypothetical protein [Empedobacter brevis]|uniref:hypothetical protein n=1 Tax=Empedobacter brevis TaxID=247 RepID=UPI0039AFAFEA